MIKLYGNLAKKFGKELNIKVNSIPEMMKALEANRPGFRSNIDKDRSYVIRRGDTFKKGLDVTQEEIEMLFGDNVWHILPLPMGHKSGIFNVILGALLVVVGVVATGLTAGQSSFLIKMGVGMMLSGVASMLAPAPGVNSYANRESPDKKPSYLFNGPFNRTASGGAVPVVYGKDVFIGSTFVSGGLTIGDVV